MAIWSATNVYARESPKMLFAMDGCATEDTPCTHGVRQGGSLGSLFYSAGFLKILRTLRTDLAVPGTRVLNSALSMTRWSSFRRRAPETPLLSSSFVMLQLKSVGSGMRMLGAPVETGTFQCQSVAETMRGGPATLL